MIARVVHAAADGWPLLLVSTRIQLGKVREATTTATTTTTRQKRKTIHNFCVVDESPLIVTSNLLPFFFPNINNNIDNNQPSLSSSLSFVVCSWAAVTSERASRLSVLINKRKMRNIRKLCNANGWLLKWFMCTLNVYGWQKVSCNDVEKLYLLFLTHTHTHKYFLFNFAFDFCATFDLLLARCFVMWKFFAVAAVILGID